MSCRHQFRSAVYSAFSIAFAVSLLPPTRVSAGEEGTLLKAFEEVEGRFLGSVESAKAVVSGKIKADVEQGLSEARRKMGVSADLARQDLKVLLANVERAIDLEADVRAQLREQIESALKETSRREFEESQKRTSRDESSAESRARQLLVEETARRDAKLKQLMDRFNSLMDEARYEEAETHIAEQVRSLDREGSQGESAVWYARNRGNVLKMYALRERRHKNYVDALFLVEKAQVPFPDDPPIVYPAAEIWEELTLQRAKYKTMDLARQGGEEQKILAALADPTTLEFIETPLKDVIDYLKDLHGIEIQIDAKALEGVAVSSDMPVTRNLKGVSLRSALRLMLKDLELSYVINNEVLLITTPEAANEAVVTKVYPVGDLVVPIRSAGANPFMMGGGMGGMGGFGGGMGMGGGGMGMGMGGGGMGMGMGGMGMGMGM